MENFQRYVIEGNGRSDLSLLFADRNALGSAILKMAEPFRNAHVDKVVALDALGFVFGALLAKELDAGLVLLRKEGKIGRPKSTARFRDYSKHEKVFELALDAIKASDRVLVADDWSETGAQLKAAIELVEASGGTVVGVSCFNIDHSVMADSSLAGYTLCSVL